MADLIDFSNIGKGLDKQMGDAALQGQRLGYNDATLPSTIQATNAQNAATVSNANMTQNMNDRQMAFQSDMTALGPNPSLADLQNIAQKYPEFSGTIKGLQNQQSANVDTIRKQMTPDGIATVAGMTSLIGQGDIDGALDLLERRAVRLENAGDVQGAATTRQWEDAIRKNPKGAADFGNQILNSGSANSAGDFYGNQSSQAKGIVDTQSVPAAVTTNRAKASEAVTNAQFAAPKAQADIGFTQSSTNVNNTNAGVGGAIPRSELPDLDKKQTVVNQSVIAAKQYGSMADTWDEAKQTGSLPSNLVGYKLDKATGLISTDSSTRQKLEREQQSLVTGAEQAGIVPGNVTDASVGRALGGVPPEGSSADVWADYWRGKQRLSSAVADYKAAEVQFARNNGNDTAGGARRPFTIKLPSGQAMLVNSGDRISDIQDKIAAQFYGKQGGSASGNSPAGSSSASLPSYGF
jgi:hypothetical protein